MFAAAGLMLLNKTDLLPSSDFDVARCLDYARRSTPTFEFCNCPPAPAKAWMLGWIGCGKANRRHWRGKSPLGNRSAAARARLTASAA